MTEDTRQFDPIVGTDFEVVREALVELRGIGAMFRYGGLGRQELLAKAALEALDRIERPGLPGMEAS